MCLIVPRHCDQSVTVSVSAYASAQALAKVGVGNPEAIRHHLVGHDGAFSSDPRPPVSSPRSVSQVLPFNTLP